MILDIILCFIFNAPGQAYIMVDFSFSYSLLLSQSKRRLDLNFEVANFYMK